MSKFWGSTPYPLLITSLVWSTGEPRSTACDKGVGERCRLRIWADCPRTALQKLAKTGFSKKLVVYVFTLLERYDTICREVVLLKRVQEISLAWSTGETRVSWSSPGGDVSKSWGSAPLNLLKISLTWSTGETRVSWSSPGGDVSKSWGSTPLTPSKNLPVCSALLRAPRYSVLRTSHLMFALCLWLKPTLGGITQTVYF